MSNSQFLKFVKATRHITLAEQHADAALYPDAQPGPIGHGNPYRWWQYVAGADWRHPEGPGSSIKGREQHPVVHVADQDALAYARWAGKQLPREVEWERAARGGLDGAEFAWGSELHAGGRAMANTFQGDFPHFNSRFDGFERTSPVGSFPPNGYGLVDMIGNVWEWTSDWYADHGVRLHALKAAGGCCTGDSPRGVTREDSISLTT